MAGPAVLRAQKTVKRYGDDRKVRAEISRAIDASPSSRSKRDLVEAFVDSVSNIGQVDEERQRFIAERREGELGNIIEAEGHKPARTRPYVQAAFPDGVPRRDETAITKVLASVSRFPPGEDHSERKQRVRGTLGALFGQFFGLSGVGG